jgi:predicted RNA-binding protein
VGSTNYWVFSVIPENWEILRKNNIWAVGSPRLKTLVKPKDSMVLYVKGTNEFRGVYHFSGEWYGAPAPIWSEEREFKKILYPFQIKIEAVQLGRADIKKLVPNLKFIEKKTFPQWPLYLKGTPANMSKPIHEADFRLIVDELEKHPKIEETCVKSGKSLHTKMQYVLVKLGMLGKCSVWVARNDRNKSYLGQKFSDLCLRELPKLGFSPGVSKLIENIDVLWLKANMIIGAFEIEESTSIYSGLLRLSDLANLVPNIKIQLFIVAPEKRRGKVLEEANRPTFSGQIMETSLNTICRIWTYEDVEDTYESLKGSRFLPTWGMNDLMKLGDSLTNMEL